MAGTWTTPRTWVDGETDTSAFFNAHIRDNIAYLNPVIYDETKIADAANFDVSSLPSGFRSLRILVDARSATGGTGLMNLRLRLNNDSGANYDDMFVVGSGGASVGANQEQAVTSAFVGNTLLDGGPGNYFSAHEITIPSYSNGLYWKNWTMLGAVQAAQAAGNAQAILMQGNWRSTAAITRVQIFCASGNLKAGSRIRIYGAI